MILTRRDDQTGEEGRGEVEKVLGRRTSISREAWHSLGSPISANSKEEHKETI